MEAFVKITPVGVKGRTESLKVIGKTAAIQRLDTFDPRDVLSIVVTLDENTICRMQGHQDLLMSIFPKEFDGALAGNTPK